MINLVVIDVEKLVDDDIRHSYRITNYYKNFGIPIPIEVEATPLNNRIYEHAVYHMKVNMGVKKIWINPDNGFIIAYEDREGYAFSQNFNNYIANIEPLEIKQKLMLRKCNKPLNIDAILDKISNFGIESLTEEERKYLDSH
jgi:hypothetical protein